MKRKHRIILSLIFFILAITFVVCGVLLFNIVPNVNTCGYENPKDALTMTGVFFSFFIAIGCLVGSVSFLVYSFMEE